VFKIFRCPGRRIECGKRSESRNSQVDAEGKTEFLSPKPFGNCCRDGNDQGFCAETEHEPSARHPEECARRCSDDRPEETENRKNERRFFGAQPINDKSSDEDHKNIRDAVDALKEPDIGV